MSIQPLISVEQIEAAVTDLGRRISREYAGRPLTILGVLTGSLMLVADLMRRIELPHQVGLLQASSYRGDATRPDALRINTEFLPPLAGRDVLLIDDILDTGRTLERLIAEVRVAGPASVRTAVLLWKRDRTEAPIQPDYVCFEIPDKFVVGYGLDFNGEYRHLPYIGTIEPSFD